MFKKITLTIVILIMAIVNIRGQANWSFVGPYSTNQSNDNKFETSQMSKVLRNPNTPVVVCATSKFGGLWISYTNGNKFDNVDMTPTGLSQALAICYKNANEILVGNYQGQGDLSLKEWDLSFSNRVSSYNYWNQTWFHYPILPNTSTPCVIKCVAVHPNDQNVIYAGTSIGLYRLSGSTWSLIVPNCHVESIVFTDNTTCFISGSDVASQYPNYSKVTGSRFIYVSTDIGNSVFQNFSPNIESDIPTITYPNSHTEICYAGPASICALTWAGSTRFLHKIVKTGSTYIKTLFTSFSDSYNGFTNSGYGRMGIAFDAVNNQIWVGQVKLFRYDIGTNSLSPSYNDFRNGNGKVHDDIHNLTIDLYNNLWVACDGGIASASLTNPSAVYFDNKNYGINVSLLYSFSGSEQEPSLYAMGGQDIINTDIYDENAKKNRYTHRGLIDYTSNIEWENDGAFIYKFNDSLMIWDASMYNHISNVSLDRGQTINYSDSQYTPNSNPPFSANSVIYDNVFGPFGSNRMEAQRTLQDPYRPGRIFQIGRFGGGGPAVMQYDFASKKMIYKFGFGPWGPGVKDISFSPSSKNSFYFITSPASPYPSSVVKYIGPNIDDCWRGHNEHYYPDPNNSNNLLPQWLDITPNSLYLNFSTIGGGAVNYNSTQLGKIFFKKIETSPWNLNVIYVAGVFGHPGDNSTESTELNFQKVKVIKFDGTAWINYSTGIAADAVVFSMIMDRYSNDGLYLSTSKGVYFRNASMTSWTLYTTGLQNIPAVQMEINYKENTVRLGTYGYGIWKSQLQCPPTTLDYSLWYNYNFSPSGVYEASNITSSWVHQTAAGPNVLRATNSIVLNPGFKATPTGNNTFFLALIHGCNPSNGTSPSMYRSSELPFSNTINEESDKDPSVMVYPNPTQDKFTISLNPNDELPQSISVRSVLGNEVKKINSVTERNLTIDLGDCSDGVYIVNVNYANKTLTNKIVKTSGR